MSVPESRTDLCGICKVPAHDTCGNDPDCSCCADTMEQSNGT